MPVFFRYMRPLIFTLPDLQKECHLAPQEWYLAGDLGNICSYSLQDRPLRAYHSLFQVTYDPPAQRWILLTGLVVYINSKMLHPSPFETKNEPDALQYFHSFEWHGDKAVYQYFVDGSLLKKTIFIAPHGFKTFVCFELINGKPVDIEIQPCLNNRNIDSFEQDLENINCMIRGDRRLDITIRSATTWHMSFSQGSWYENPSSPLVWYPYEHYGDGYSSEKVFIPGQIRSRLSTKNPLHLVCSFQKRVLRMDNTETALAQKKAKIREKSRYISVPELPYLIQSLNTFLVKRENLHTKTILAGYPWFMDWGRDSMITLRGMLYLLRSSEVQMILDTFWKYLSRGMIPNCFDSQEVGKAYYNTVDATLWLFIVMYDYYCLNSNRNYLEKYLPYMEEIIFSHIKGTRWEIRVDKDGLLSGGNRNTQLTWMDVKIGDKAVTPRMGKAIEVNALWYNALKIFRYFCGQFRKEFEYEQYIQLFEENFLSAFFISDQDHLADWVYEGEVNCQNRPNQVFCLALPFRDYLPVTVQQRVFNTVTEELLTQYGLRTLSPRDNQYRGFYGGARYERDSAYHQGTVWPWLMGPYIDAYVNTTTDSKIKRKEVIRRHLSPLLSQVRHGSAGSIPEVFSGDWPHEAGGCFAQAWSAAELVRIIYRYLSPEESRD